MSARANVEAACFYCDAPVASGWERDHFPIPYRAGGFDVVCACRDCHNLKDRCGALVFDFAATYEADECSWSSALILGRLLEVAKGRGHLYAEDVTYIAGTLREHPRLIRIAIARMLADAVSGSWEVPAA